ncbi:polyketide synthase dehydratase domain-containing protein [Actinoalloteichus sp. AHMU CJ021]|uniref:polyketide synthase dehydratase domain-containing protein n=2 Tax=Actinoalloteichus TaxID=65496 RepID=UPI0026BDCB8F
MGVLSAMGQDCAPEGVFVPVLRRDRPEPETVVGALARVFVHGTEVDWAGYYGGCGARRVPLPTYAFQHERYWLQPTGLSGNPGRLGLEASEHPLLGAVLGLAGSGDLALTGRVSLDSWPWLADHQVLGSVLVPGAALADLALYAGQQSGCPVLEELTLEAPLVLRENEKPTVQIVVEAGEDSGRSTINIHSRRTGDDDWVRHATGVLAASTPVVTESLSTPSTPS